MKCQLITLALASATLGKRQMGSARRVSADDFSASLCDIGIVLAYREHLVCQLITLALASATLPPTLSEILREVSADHFSASLCDVLQLSQREKEGSVSADHFSASLCDSPHSETVPKQAF